MTPDSRIDRLEVMRLEVTMERIVAALSEIRQDCESCERQCKT